MQDTRPQDHWSLCLPVNFTVLEAVTFRQTCQTVLDQNPQLQSLALDLSATTFIDSSGIGALVICHRLCHQRQISLWLQGVGPQVKMALSLTDLDQVFAIRQPIPTAIAAGSPVLLTQGSISTHPSVASRPKRLMDIVGAIVGLGITAVLTIPIAIAIKCHDGGPIFFSQIRCSWMGKRFRIWKFRTMVVNAERLKHQVANQVEGPLFKNENDPRITPAGRFLRKTSLDELPQFWNVLKGEMSLVGTRPPTPDELERYDVPAWQRLNVKPGMTGEWQVHGRSTIRCFEDVIELDLRYQQQWSLWYDVKLMIKTVLVLFTARSGAA